MYLKSKKFACVLLSLFLGGGIPFCKMSSVFSADFHKNNVKQQIKSNEPNESIHVSDIFELLQAVDKISKWGKIVLEDDIDMLSLKLSLNNSVVLDLNGHTIRVGRESEGIIVENKVMVNRKKIVKQYSSDYVWDEKNHKVKKPFLGGDGYKLNVVDYEASEQYDDDICVTVRNGKIIRESEKNGEDGIPNTWFNCSGRSGETPRAPLILNSGNIYLSNLQVIGGDGGNGGNGACYAGAHLPINGGCGADGGNGGNGGSAIVVSRKEVKLILNDDCKVSSGKEGKAGKGGEPSENYWFYKSRNGVDGRDGVVCQEIVYKYKK